jgi:hypothetical protein
VEILEVSCVLILHSRFGTELLLDRMI